MHHECADKGLQAQQNQSRVNLLRSPMFGAFVLNLVFAIVEFIGGYWADSFSIYADALHDLGDALVLGSGAYLEYLSRTVSPRHSYGTRRWSVLSALFSAGVLIAGSLAMIGFGLFRLFDPGTPIGSSMVVIAVLGILFNAFSIFVLGHNHDDSDCSAKTHSPSHNYSMFSLHLWEDLLGWVTVLVGGIVIWTTNWYWVDPLLSVCISLFILRFAWKSLKGVQSILTQAYPAGFDPLEWTQTLTAIEGVESVKDLHAWSLDQNQHVASLQIVCSPDSSHEQIKDKVRSLFAEAGKYHVTVEVEC